MNNHLKKWGGMRYLLPAALCTCCVAWALHGYTAPVYEVKASDLSELSDENPENEESAASGNFDLEDGFYEGTGVGYAGNITVSVEIKDHSIVGIEILSVEADDKAFFNRAKGVIDRIISSQSTNVDAVSGATYSSRGIISAVENALTGKVNQEEPAKAAASSPRGSLTVADVKDAAAYRDGTYYGNGTGFSGDLKVKVVIKDGKIVSVDVVSSGDDAAYLKKASGLIKNIISGQSTNVDTVSGATYSSTGIITAVRDALSQAAVEPDTKTNKTETVKSDAGKTETGKEGRFPYNDGIYYGIGEGYLGEIKVALVLKNHTIKAVMILENEADDEAFFNRAKVIADRIVEQQNTDVDVVSGATYSSKGILEAVKQALLEAEQVTAGKKEPPANDNTDSDGSGNGSEDTSGDESLNGKDDSSGNDSKDPSQESIYRDGDYTWEVLCEPDEEQDFMPYLLSLTVSIANDKIVAVTDIKGTGDDYDSGNDPYLNKAVKGTSKYPGVVSQILDQGVPEHIDVVTRATCSSNAIIKGCQEILEQARIQQGEEAEE
ncbi:Na(+)-translocating NADH-quinone reductase subunit C [uncultured Roseburia sp.]|uniref:FMN-binding protein n=1 Tax=Brotonthovivens ammoniilytica TaxID=2981725 RepID=A0ABT2TK07_9FIRM|nr:FMN-binding protein [Brotonthovivens ammoniilytica]MCU6762549.1 FMN-binding protein [Brotonthovivens ammoniilytica]SCI75339.1 Na(+)-translocating NADH-quinone reductase subunit C [uncultured Roseburia sp.]